MAPWSKAREGLRRGERWKLSFWHASALSAADLPALDSAPQPWFQSEDEWVRADDAREAPWRHALPRDKAVSLAAMTAGVSPETYAMYFEATCIDPATKQRMREADLYHEIVATEII